MYHAKSCWDDSESFKVPRYEQCRGPSRNIRANHPKNSRKMMESTDFSDTPPKFKIAWLCLLVFTNCASQRDHPLGCQTDLRKKFRNTFKNIYKTLECFMLLSSYFFLRTLFRLNFSGSHGLFSGISSRTRCSIYQNCPSFSV